MPKMAAMVVASIWPYGSGAIRFACAEEPADGVEFLLPGGRPRGRGDAGSALDGAE